MKQPKSSINKNTLCNTVQFRFYAELNNYLTAEKRKVAFDYEFSRETTVGAAITTLGIPLAQVDLILVNSKSVPFNYLLQNNDRIVVYPTFELFDITELTQVREKPLRNPQFILDVHLGRLTKYLRILGFDCYYSNTLTDQEIIERSSREKRIILTKDRNLLYQHDITRGYLIKHTDPYEQIKEVTIKFNLVRLVKPLTSA